MASSSACALSLGSHTRTHALPLSPLHSQRASGPHSPCTHPAGLRPTCMSPACALQVASTECSRPLSGTRPGRARDGLLRASPSLLNFPKVRRGKDQLPSGGGATALPRVVAEAKPRGRDASSSTSGAPKQPTGGSHYLGKLGSDSPATRAAAGAYPAPPRRHPLAARAVFVTLAIAVALPVLGGVIVSSVANPLQDWYRDLEKPSWEPPDWLFGAVWSVLYVFMGLASWLVWADGGWAKQGWALKLYCAQLIVNYAWPIVFFSLHQLPLGVAVIGALVLLVNATMRAFYSVNAVAGWLMLPYLAWTTFALVLNWAIWRKNRLSGDTMSGASWSAFPRQVDNPSRDDW